MTSQFVYLAIIAGCLAACDTASETKDAASVEDASVADVRDATASGVHATLGPAGCPTLDEARRANGQACSLAAGTLCEYQQAGSFELCSCGCETPNVWVCFASVGGSDCPLTPPTTGEPCLNQGPCPYLPSAATGGNSPVCVCINGPNTWRCTTNSVVGPVPCVPDAGD